MSQAFIVALLMVRVPIRTNWYFSQRQDVASARGLDGGFLSTVSHLLSSQRWSLWWWWWFWWEQPLWWWWGSGSVVCRETIITKACHQTQVETPICVLRWCFREDAESHWLHLFDFSPQCVASCAGRLLSAGLSPNTSWDTNLLPLSSRPISLLSTLAALHLAFELESSKTLKPQTWYLSLESITSSSCGKHKKLDRWAMSNER